MKPRNKPRMSAEWEWRVDYGLSHLVHRRDPTSSYCGVWGNFSTSGGPELDACKRCLKAWHAWQRDQELNVEPAGLRECRACSGSCDVEQARAFGVGHGHVVEWSATCRRCGAARSERVVRGSDAEQFVVDVERLGMRPFQYDVDDYTEHEFWITYTSRGRAAALAEALQHGYQVVHQAH